MWPTTCLFCFVTLRPPKGQHIPPPPPPHPFALLVPLESPWCVRVHQGSFIMFRPMVQKLLNFEVAHCRFNKWKKKKLWNFGWPYTKHNPSDVPPNFLQPCWILWELDYILERMGVGCWRVPCIILSWFWNKIPGGVGREWAGTVVEDISKNI